MGEYARRSDVSHGRVVLNRLVVCHEWLGKMECAPVAARGSDLRSDHSPVLDCAGPSPWSCLRWYRGDVDCALASRRSLQRISRLLVPIERDELGQGECLCVPGLRGLMRWPGFCWPACSRPTHE